MYVNKRMFLNTEVEDVFHIFDSRVKTRLKELTAGDCLITIHNNNRKKALETLYLIQLLRSSNKAKSPAQDAREGKLIHLRELIIDSIEVSYKKVLCDPSTH